MRAVGYGVFDKLMSSLVYGMKVDMDADFRRVAAQLDREKGPELQPPKPVALMPLPRVPAALVAGGEGVENW